MIVYKCNGRASKILHSAELPSPSIASRPKRVQSQLLIVIELCVKRLIGGANGLEDVREGLNSTLHDAQLRFVPHPTLAGIRNHCERFGRRHGKVGHRGLLFLVETKHLRESRIAPLHQSDCPHVTKAARSARPH